MASLDHRAANKSSAGHGSDAEHERRNDPHWVFAYLFHNCLLPSKVHFVEVHREVRRTSIQFVSDSPPDRPDRGQQHTCITRLLESAIRNAGSPIPKKDTPHPYRFSRCYDCWGYCVSLLGIGDPALRIADSRRESSILMP